MIGGLVWVRLVDGRLWHLGPCELFTWAEGDHWMPHVTRTLCERKPGMDAEVLTDAPPIRGQVCSRCVETVTEQARLARLAWSLDPRRNKTDQLPAASEPSLSITEPSLSTSVKSELQDSKELQVGEPTRPAKAPSKPDATADLVAALKDAVEAARGRRDATDPEAGIQQLTPTPGES